jgi:hypothetical protein
MFGPCTPSCLNSFVKRLHAHRADALVDELADRIIDHRADDAGLEPETIGEIRRAVEFAAADMDVAVRGFAERDDAGIKTVDERAEGKEVERAGFTDVQAVFHSRMLVVMVEQFGRGAAMMDKRRGLS